MSYCANCGVELEESYKACPLCGYSIGTVQNLENDTAEEGYTPSDIILIHKNEKRRHLWEISGIIAFSGILVCTIVNYVTFRQLSWSLYADTSILAAWIALTLTLLAPSKYIVVLPGLLVTILLMLFLFNLFALPLDWFFAIGLPVTLALAVAVGIILILWNLAHFRGFNILSIAFLVLSGFCIVTEAFIDKYVNNKIEISWSVIVAVAIFPISLFLFFIHYRMKKGKRLDSYFHV